jgi:integrase
VIKMATPLKDPRTGIFYLRRGIPKELRPYLGGRWEHKVSLETRDPAEARRLYPEVNTAFEAMLDAARRLQRADRVKDAVSIADAYLAEWTEESLRRLGVKLAMLEWGSHRYRRGEGPGWGVARYDFGAPPPAEDLRDHVTRFHMLRKVEDLRPILGWEACRRIRELPTMQPIAWMIEEAAARAGVEATVGREIYTAIGEVLLTRICQACEPKIDALRTRLIPPTVLSIPSTACATPAPNQTPSNPSTQLASHERLHRSGPSLTEVFADWCNHKPREKKLIDEWSLAIRRFDELFGAMPVADITDVMVREYRKICSRLPSRAPKEISSQPLREQTRIAAEQDLVTLAPATVNKALSAIRVTLDHAVEEMQVISGNVAKLVKGLEVDGEVDSRLPFTPDDLKRIFTSELPEGRSGVSRGTVLWVLLLGAFTGCRLGELCHLRPGNVRTERGIAFIAIERDRKLVRNAAAAEAGTVKRAKTSSAYRDIPVHDTLKAAGFLDLVAARKEQGADWLFPELPTNRYGNRAQRLSRVLNDWLDSIGLSDPEHVYHSFRHTVRRVLRGRVDRDIVDLIAGHSDGSVGSRYGRGAALEPLKEAVAKIEYPEVAWDVVIQRARATLGAKR